MSGTPNVTSVVWDGVEGSYIITIEGETYQWQNYTTNVSLVIGSTAEKITTGAVGDKLEVQIYGASGEPIQDAFQFVVYKMIPSSP